VFAQRIVLLALLSCALAACGGGGGGGSNETGGAGVNPPPTTPPTTPPGGDPPTNPPTSGPNTDELSSAQNAKLRIFQEGADLIIDWLDLFDNELGYQLQRRGADGEWQAVLTYGPGDGERMVWMPVIAASGSYRLVALLDDYSVPLHAGLNETEFPIDVGPSTMTITLDQAEPVTGGVQVSMQNAAPALSVTYQLNGQPIAESTAGNAFTATLPAQHLLHGQHTLTALVQKTEGLFIFLDRPLQVSNPNPALLMNVTQSSSDATAPLKMSARATSAAGIAMVEFFVNNTPVSVLTTPDESGRYIVTIDRTTLPSGPNVFRAVATDYDGANVSMEQRFNINQWPSLQVTGLFDGMIAANGRIDVQATFGDDMPGATLTILVGQQRLVQTQTSPLNGSYLLEGIAPGQYSVLVRVRDATGKVNSRTYQLIVPSTGLSYELIATDAEDLLGTGDGMLLYRNKAGELILRNATGAATTVSPAPNLGTLHYQFSDGRFIGFYPSSHVYVIAPSGQSLDLTPTSQQQTVIAPNVHGRWVSWVPAGAAGRVITAYNLETEQTTTVVLNDSTAPGIATSQHYRHELFGPAGAERVLFSSTINGTPGIYSRALVNGTNELLLAGPNFDVQSDGTRLMWQQFIDDSHRPLMTAPLNNPTASTVLSQSTFQSFLENGVICWLDRSYVLHVYDGSTSTQLAENVLEIGENTLKDGRLIYRDDAAMHVWTVAGGERVWLEAPARQVIQSDGVAYFLTGSSGPLYRVTLP
jgi:hypothetical protein